MIIKEQILAEFKAAHPRLVELNPDISVWEIVESTEESWEQLEKPVYQIDVKHEFLFDLRLIPTEFNGIRVKRVCVGEYPREFPSDDESLPLDEWFAPERYVRFVERNLNVLSEKLNKPDLTKGEALDALTGGFQKHVEWCEG